jgi:hypothetical protein
VQVIDSAPRVDVSDAEYTRLLGFPRGHVLDGRARELADEARAWFGAHGRPWFAAREVSANHVAGNAVELGRHRFESARLARAFIDGGADRAFVVAVSAGPELVDAAQERWRAEEPDAYFFLEMFGSAVVEQLVTDVGARLCAWADGEGRMVLPHDSPGYTGWDVAEQPRLFSLVVDQSLPGPLAVLESGMLTPKKSLLAVFALAPKRDTAASLADFVPCTTCAFGPCQFRRAPYDRAGTMPVVESTRAVVPARHAYVTPIKALRRWAAERLTLSAASDGGMDAVFRYDGTTCVSMGHPLAFEYRVTLGPRERGFPIEGQRCTPVAGDDGHRSMCVYLREGDALVERIAQERPLAGQPLDGVLGWKRPLMGAGCYCDATSRAHKWGLVLETLHYALSREEGIEPR